MLLPYKPIRSIMHNSISGSIGSRSEYTAFQKHKEAILLSTKINLEKHHYYFVSLIGKAEVTNVVKSVLKGSSDNPYKPSNTVALALADTDKTLVWISSILLLEKKNLGYFNTCSDLLRDNPYPAVAMV
uniref:Uncharacterized protein n=1 Tax=Pseudo-nitzschia australis TaxID=44445 RepID=A0A7S4AP66_9STRA|mmetsp:Transcript_25149/g.55152  ORF Transcript_25149/g.55152 Transcript_25149/m.55152 type:complete len:129 (-) Transcript_25149:182-568(-)